MEMMGLQILKKYSIKIILLLGLFFLVKKNIIAQPQNKQYYIEDSRLHITLPKKISPKELDVFVQKFKLEKLHLNKFIEHSITDSLMKEGWVIEENTNESFTISKSLIGNTNVQKHTDILALSNSNVKEPDNLFATFGVNFIKKESFVIEDSLVIFRTKVRKAESKVLLAGSFTNWQHNAIEMQKVDGFWETKVKLGAGKHLYKYIVDGEWELDENNKIDENDGRGNTNSVFYKPNYIFTLKGYNKARKVVLAGSFNSWDSYTFKMTKNKEGTWELPVYLSNGTYTYRFVVDEEWVTDDNAKKTPNEFNEYNNIISIGETFNIQLKGFVDAKKVFLLGNFNNYRDYELQMNKTNFGWEFDYAFGDGNYEMKFLVDGVLYNANGEKLKENDAGSILINNPNYTFILKGFENAKKVLISGDFNNWSKTGFPMKKENGIWLIDMYLTKGKHLYKFIVDNEWILDPKNKLWEENEYGSGNSILWKD